MIYRMTVLVFSAVESSDFAVIFLQNIRVLEDGSRSLCEGTCRSSSAETVWISSNEDEMSSVCVQILPCDRYLAAVKTCSRERENLVLPISNSIFFCFLQDHPVTAYSFFFVFSSILSFPQ